MILRVTHPLPSYTHAPTWKGGSPQGVKMMAGSKGSWNRLDLSCCKAREWGGQGLASKGDRWGGRAWHQA